MAVFQLTGKPGSGIGDKTYEGAVLGKREANYYDDSDFYAVVWDEAEQAVKEVQYATTRGWTYENYAKVDATPEVKAKAQAAIERDAFDMLAQGAAANAKKPTVGKTVKVLRAKNKGKVGTVTWTGRQVKFGYTRYGRVPPWGYENRVRVQTPEGALFTVDTNLEVLDASDWMLDEATLRDQAKDWAARIASSGQWGTTLNPFVVMSTIGMSETAQAMMAG